MNKKTSAATTILIILLSAFTIIHLTAYAKTTPPVALKIYIGPNNILADNATYTCVFIQLIDAYGNPTRAPQATAVALSSSAPGIGTVDQTITIPQNATYASANFTSTYLPGTTTITATAPNYVTVSSTLTTIGPYPYKTTVYGFPTVLPADGETYGAVMVQLQDLNGVPARAPNNVNVSLFSSHNDTASVTPNITILQGQTFAIANFTTTTTPGTTNITAVGHGYASTQQLFSTKNLTLSGPAEKLGIFVGPPQVLADNNVYRQIAVVLQDGLGNPTTLPSNTTITLASADNTIATIDDEITISSDSTYALASLHTTYRAGDITLTAATNGLAVDTNYLTAVGYTPSKLVVYCAPYNLPADTATYPAIQVQLQDELGRPARNPDSNTTLKLFSSNLAVGDVATPVTIPLGQTQVATTFTLTTLSGSSIITALASNYTTGQAGMVTYVIDFVPIDASVTVDLANVAGGGSVQVSAYLTVDGAPLTGAQVTFSSDNGGTFSTVQEANGYYNTTFTAPVPSQSTVCTITVDASKTGCLDGSAIAQVTVAATSTPTASPTATPTPVPSANPSPTPTPTATPTSTTAPQSTTTTTGTASIKLTVRDAMGVPLSGINVSSTTQPTGMQALSAVTNQAGYVTFQNVVGGSYVFEVGAEGYESVDYSVSCTEQQSASFTVYLYESSGANSSSVGESSTDDADLGFVLPVVVAIVVVVAVVGAVLFVRRRWNIRLSTADP